MNLSFDKDNFFDNSVPFYFNSAEFHYFRVPKIDWEKRLTLLKKSCCDTLATYIPWRIHENNENEWRFDCRDGYTDLTEFLTLAKKMEISVVLRVGPYSYSELMLDGLPDYLTGNYPEILAKNKQGEIFSESAVTYLHPTFLKRVELFYQKVADIIRPFLVKNGGSVIMVQLDNETLGVQLWRSSLDYSPELWRSKNRYADFLSNRYRGDIELLRKLYGVNWQNFSEADPCKNLSSDNSKALQIRDYQDFSACACAEFLVYLRDLLIKNDIAETIFCNNAGSPNLFTYLKEACTQLGDNFIAGVDHYWNLSSTWKQNSPTNQRFMYHYISCELMKNSKFPPWVPEFQYGSISAYPPVTMEDLSCALFTHLGFGMKGHNGYVFTGGKQVANSGWSCNIYDYYAPVSASGECRPTFYAVQKFGEFVKNHSDFLNLKADYDFPLLFDYNVYRATSNLNFDRIHCADNSEIDGFYTLGVCATAFASGMMTEILDAECDFDMNRKTLTVVSSGVMSEKLQTKLLDYMENGGNVLLWGSTPKYNEFMQESTLLADGAKIPLTKRGVSASRAIDFGDDQGEIAYNSGPFFVIDGDIENAEIIARETKSNAVVSYHKKVGKGSLTFSGCLFNMACESHSRFFLKLLRYADTAPRFMQSDNYLIINRRKNQEKIWFFITNASTAKHYFKGEYLLENEAVTLPELRLEPMDVKILEYNLINKCFKLIKE